LQYRPFLFFPILCSLLVAVPARSQEPPPPEKKLGWQDKAELALVVTAGNSETSTFGFRNQLARIWTDAELKIEVAGLRTETATVTATPVGTSIDDYVLQEESESQLTAENYLARAKYDRTIRPRLYAYGTGGWDRNVFAGIENRYTGAGGIGNIWHDREDFRFRTDYGVSVTHQIPTYSSEETFAGLRLSADLMRKLSASTTLTHITIADENFDQTDDFRLDSLTALAVTMSERLALQVSVKFLFDNLPSFTEADLISSRTGLPLGVVVPVQADKLDTLINVALVVNF
jgi:putative salt-induced outer membrane protein YdiY